MVVLCFLFAIMMPTMMFMYIDMHTLRKENMLLKSKISKYSGLIERCDR